MAESGGTIFVGTFYDGVYRSTDNGQSWTGVHNGLPHRSWVTSLAVKGDRVFAGDYFSGVSMSTNNGDSWTRLNSGLSNDQVRSLAVVGDDLFAGTANGIFVLHENSDVWTALGTGLPPNAFISAIAQSGEYLLAGESYGKIYRSADGGVSWQEASNGVPGTLGVESFLETGGKTYACTSSGLYASSDHGGSWAQVTQGIPTIMIFGMISHGSSLFAATMIGPFVSLDNGVSWTLANTGLGYSETSCLLSYRGRLITGGYATGIFISDDSGSTWTESNDGFSSVSVCAIVRKEGNLFAGTDQGIFVSGNNGASWRPVNSGLPGTKLTTQLLQDGSNLYASFDGGGVHVSSDNGDSWTSLSTGLTSNQVYDILKTGDHFFAATPHGLFKYSHTSSEWTLSSIGMPNTHVQCLGMTGDRIFANVYQNGVYVSDDYGQTWTNESPEGTEFFSHQFLVKGDTIFSAGWGGVFVSENKASDWQKVETGINNILEGILTVDDYLFVAGYDGVFFSMDDGISWMESTYGFPVTASARSFHIVGDTLLAGTTQGVWAIALTDFHPVIESLSQTSGSPGDVILIFGRNFNASVHNSVTFNGKEGEILEASSTYLIVRVPADAQGGTIVITVNDKTASADFCVSPGVPVISASDLSAPTTLASNVESEHVWYLNDAPIPGATSTTFAATEPGVYTASTVGFCESAVSNAIEVVITGIEENRNGINWRTTAYPNPAHSDVTLDLEDTETMSQITVQIYSAIGEEIANYTSEPGPAFTFNISDYMQGLYFFKARQGIKTWSGKFYKN